MAALLKEEALERAADREYRAPLKAELEQLRRARLRWTLAGSMNVRPLLNEDHPGRP